MTFFDKLEKQQEETKSIVCCGLDIDKDLIPQVIDWREVSIFLEKIVDATAEFVCSFKVNLATYLVSGWLEIVLQDIINYINKRYPEILVILDAKWGEVPHIAEKYVKVAFERFKANAVTINPLLGQDSCQPFLDQKDNGIFFLCRTSNPGSQEFQNLRVQTQKYSGPFWQNIAYQVVRHWNTNRNCGLVIGATYPLVVKAVRQRFSNIPILIPGIGAQEGDLERVVAYGLNNFGQGLIIGASRSIIYASNGPDFVEAAAREAKRLRDRINQLKRIR